MPAPSALLTPSATHLEGSPNAAIGPVSGVIMPIRMVLLAARDDWNIHGDAMALAPPAAISLTTLRRCGSTLSLRLFFTPHFIVIITLPVSGDPCLLAMGLVPLKSHHRRPMPPRLLACREDFDPRRPAYGPGRLAATRCPPRGHFATPPEKDNRP